MWLEALDEKPRQRGSTTSERQTGVCRSAKLMSARADKRSEILYRTKPSQFLGCEGFVLNRQYLIWIFLADRCLIVVFLLQVLILNVGYFYQDHVTLQPAFVLVYRYQT